MPGQTYYDRYGFTVGVLKQKLVQFNHANNQEPCAQTDSMLDVLHRMTKAGFVTRTYLSMVEGEN